MAAAKRAAVAKARLIAFAVVLLVAGCGSTAPVPDAHPLPVAATPFALAEVARRVGLTRVVVSDRGRVVIHVTTATWVDPVAMEAVTREVADALVAADPEGRSSYQVAARAYQAQLAALDIDYRSSLADCARHDIVTADGAFAPLAARYNFVDDAASDAGVAHLIDAERIPVLFTEPAVPADEVDALAQATHTRVEELDTTKVRTPVEVARGATYLSLMTDNLAKLRSALACTAPS